MPDADHAEADPGLMTAQIAQLEFLVQILVRKVADLEYKLAGMPAHLLKIHAQLSREKVAMMESAAETRRGAQAEEASR